MKGIIRYELSVKPADPATPRSDGLPVGAVRIPSILLMRTLAGMSLAEAKMATDPQGGINFVWGMLRVEDPNAEVERILPDVRRAFGILEEKGAAARLSLSVEFETEGGQL